MVAFAHLKDLDRIDRTVFDEVDERGNASEFKAQQFVGLTQQRSIVGAGRVDGPVDALARHGVKVHA